MAERTESRTKRHVHSAERLLGNVFLGIAVGLIGYYAVTNLVTRSAQSDLQTQIPRVTDEPAATNTMDFSGWRSHDRAYWLKLAEGQAFGRLVIPSAKIDSMVVKGVSRADLRKGPGWIAYTDLPGPTGNCGISGHRTTYGAPFRQLDELKPGDTIRFYSPYRRYTYRVRKKFAVTPDKTEVVRTTKKPTLTLTACHPPYSARYRLIVQSDLVEVIRLAE